jgi:hypothetical protein
MQTCFEWFTKGISDLEADTQSQLFQKEILKLDISRMTATGMNLGIFQLQWCSAFASHNFELM